MKIIGYELKNGLVPITEPNKGSIVTQAFILCSECGSIISSCSGPKYNAICIPCSKKYETTH